ncbi:MULTISPECIES: hypothetical protein [Burkholderiaceae]|uniref:hypothetical protein n=1 Tax=Burkholderiaceae TaxID=119060 RepID=UPI001F21AD56|nr:MULTISPECIES: hypothetical protein [Burkholderiaceae]
MRRLVGYGRLRGLEATQTLACLYEVPRLYINFFQPSFKLQSKTRHGARVTKRYEAPLTPLERVLRSASVPQATTPARAPLADFLASLGTAWQDGEVRPTHQRKARVPHTWRNREDPFEHTWPTIQRWLEAEPGITAKKLHERLVAMAPAMYSGAQLRTLQRRVKA